MTATSPALTLDEIDRAESVRGPIDIPNATREDLARHFATRGVRKGAEVGVERGIYTERLCQANPDALIFAIDPWAAYRGYREHVTQAKLDGFRDEAYRRLAPYQCDIIQARSVEASKLFQDGELDFVYIDANHELSHVIADLTAWAPKVRPGGIVAGHDYRKVKGNGPFHVVQAVQAYTDAYKIRPYFVLRGESAPTWLWVQR